MLRITDTVKHLIIINFILWLGTLLLKSQGIDLNEILALYYPENENFKFWQVVTHMFMHDSSGPMHIIFNMLALWMFGTPLEQMWGRNKFLFFYFSTGLGAFLLHTLANFYQFNSGLEALTQAGVNQDTIMRLLNDGQYDSNWIHLIGEKKALGMAGAYGIPAVGASGAIFGILVAFGMLFPNAELMLIFLPIPVKAKYFIPIIIALELFSGLTGVSIFSPSNTAYFAHIGGALTGFLIMWFWKRNQFNSNRWD